MHPPPDFFRSRRRKLGPPDTSLQIPVRANFEEIDELTFRKLFVGMTRARLKLVLVLSERAAVQLLVRM